MRGLVALGLGLVLAAALVGTAVVASAVSLLGVGGGAPAGSAAATARIPPAMIALYEQAAATCPGLPWTILAAIGTVESDNGQSTLPGVHAGANGAGAQGPMQFEPATFAAYDEPVPPGGAAPPSPYDPADAVYAAARLLCANGAAGGADPAAAVYAYNHSDLVRGPGAGPGAVLRRRRPRGTRATPAPWRCSGPWPRSARPMSGAGRAPVPGSTARASSRPRYRVAGVSLPRVAQDQYDATPKLAAGTPLAPGDLVFFGSGPRGIDHVGLFVGIVGGRDVMVDAPYTGADVRADAFPSTPGASFGSLVFVGATRPA